MAQRERDLLMLPGRDERWENFMLYTQGMGPYFSVYYWWTLPMTTPSEHLTAWFSISVSFASLCCACADAPTYYSSLQGGWFPASRLGGSKSSPRPRTSSSD